MAQNFSLSVSAVSACGAVSSQQEELFLARLVEGLCSSWMGLPGPASPHPRQLSGCLVLFYSSRQKFTAKVPAKVHSTGSAFNGEQAKPYRFLPMSNTTALLCTGAAFFPWVNQTKLKKSHLFKNITLKDWAQCSSS